MGLLNQERRQGLYDHSHVAFTPEQLCLGVSAAGAVENDSFAVGLALFGPLPTRSVPSSRSTMPGTVQVAATDRYEILSAVLTNWNRRRFSRTENDVDFLLDKTAAKDDDHSPTDAALAEWGHFQSSMFFRR